jgi:hypothetical protein
VRRHAKAPTAGSTESTGSSRGSDRGAVARRGLARDSRGSGAPSRRFLSLGVLTALLLAVLAFGSTSALAAPTVTVESEPEYTSAVVKVDIDNADELQYFGIFIAINPDSEGWTAGAYPEHPLPPGHNTFSSEFTGLKPDTTYKVKVETYAEAAEELFETQAPYPTFTTKHVDPPAVTLDPVSAITTTTAHFAGTVNANAPAGSLTANQEEAYETKWQLECEPSCAKAPSGVVKTGDAGFKASEAGAPIALDASSLEINTTYQLRLVAISGNGSKETVAEQSFTTPPAAPTVTPAPGASDGQGGYVIEGIVNPNGSSITDCHFEYGPTAAYVFQAPCSPTPVGRTEVQKLTFGHENCGPTEGQLRFLFRGQETGDIDWGASAATVEAALKGLSTIGPNGIVGVTPLLEDPFSPENVTGYIVTFGGPLAELNLPKIGFKPGTDPLGNAGGDCGTETTTTTTEGGNNSPIVVEAHLTGLTPGATYHFQLVATSGAGTGTSGDQIFVPTQDPLQPPCPNEAVRQENNSLALPECRAYEQASPANKAGYKADFLGFFEGDSVLFQTSAGNIANSGQGSGNKNNYVANRTASGWETIPNLNPAGTIFAGPEKVGALHNLPVLYSEKLQTSYWYTAPGSVFTDDLDSYLREPDGRFTLIGHHTPTGFCCALDIHTIGGSADLSHIVLQGLSSQPGVHEFVGTGNSAPRRVDLDNTGQPISECLGPGGGGGATPAGAEGKAVSKDGQTIIVVVIGGCGSGPPADEVWARVDGTTSYDASESHCTRVDCNAPAPARYAGAASDGSSVFFTTKQQLLNSDTDQADDLYVYHLPTASDPNPSPALTEVSGTGPGADTEEGVTVSENGSTAEGVTVSADGSTALFVSPAVLAGNDDAFEEAAHQGDDNLYVWRRDSAHLEGQVAFVGKLISNDLNPIFSPEHLPYNHDSEMTSDGRYVVLNTASPLVPTDSDDGYDVYRYDTESGQLTRVSTGPLGTGGNVDGFDAYLASAWRPVFYGTPIDPWASPLSISADGQDIVFATDQGLVPRDGNGATDVYLWKAGRVSLISSGAVGNNVSGNGEFAISPSGQDIYFVTGEALSPSDGDAVRDIYDARVGGGFSFAEKEVCQGESCQPAGPGPPSEPNPTTNQARAPESPPKANCPKGKVLKKGKCVKKHKKHHKKHKGKRGAKKHGGAK